MRNATRNAALLLLTAIITGCAAADLTRKSTANRVCEVHGTEMTAKELPLLPGWRGYDSQMNFGTHVAFPHYDGPRWADTEFVLFPARSARDYVCPECTLAYEQFMAARPSRVTASTAYGPAHTAGR
jgi:hypothetical protein